MNLLKYCFNRPLENLKVTARTDEEIGDKK